MAKRGESVLDLIEVMDRLRSPGGCPWDARQTHQSLVEYLVEEAYETVEAIEGGDDSGLREELGDLLLQVVFHARIAQERGDKGWDVDDVARGIITEDERNGNLAADKLACRGRDLRAVPADTKPRP